MPNNAWKQLERDVCAYFGTTRVPGSGAITSLKTQADSFHPALFLEMKRRKEAVIWKWYEEFFGKSTFGGKVPKGLLIIRNYKERGILYVVHSSHLLAINKELEKADREERGHAIPLRVQIRQKIMAYSLFRETEEKAEVEHKIPVVAVRQHRKVGFLMLLNPQDLKRISYERERVLASIDGGP